MSFHSDRLSYEIHTMKEAALMKEGKKPFSFFCKHKNEKIDLAGLTENQNFASDFISFEEWVYGDLVYYFFYLDGQGWRVPAYKLVVEARTHAGHSRQLEWMEGKLLGYTTEQNVEFLENVFDPMFDG